MKRSLHHHGIAVRNSWSGGGKIKYGNTKTYDGSASYAPDIYSRVGKTTEEESKDYYTSPTTATYAQKGSLKVKQTQYSLTLSADYMDDKPFRQLIVGDGTTYWLASRYVNCGARNAGFGLRLVSSNGLNGNDLLYSGRATYTCGCRVRPVVTLKSNIKISTAGGTEDSPREISL